VQAAGDADKTTFVAAAGSFLDIFCVDQAQAQDDEVNDEELKQADDTGKEAGKRKTQRKVMIFLSELAEAFGASERKGDKRRYRWGLAVAAVIGLLTLLLYFWGSPESRLKDLLADGDYARAAAAASQYLARDPDDAQLKALGTEALLKANVPQWLNLLKAREFDRASAIVAGMKQLGRHNADVQPLVSELEWIGNLEKFAAGRGGADKPIQNSADESGIKRLLKQWDDDMQGHQRAFATISSHVPEFRDAYAQALSDLRKLALISSRKGVEP
jgi:hypothetical protein